MRATLLFQTALFLAIGHAVGCQSWQGASFPMQNATRVPPPGTGTYPVPSGYYNNNSTSALTPAAQAMQANNAAATGLRAASGPLPTTNMTANNAAISPNSTYSTSNLSSAMAAPAKLTSGFQATGNAGSGVVPAAFQSELANTSSAAASHLSDSSSDGSYGSGAVTTDAPSLQWQQFGGQ
jgi:hypothetical protein